jgi:hypothetical protein
MMKILGFSGILIVGLLITGCQKNDALSKNPEMYEIEEYTRHHKDNDAVFTYDQYRQLLQELSKPKYRVLTINEFRKYKDGQHVLVGFRHDIDWHPFKALEMARLENEYGIRSTWYILPTAPYFSRFDLDEVCRYYSMLPLYRELAQLGEVGIHLDLLTVMADWQLDPMMENRKDLNLLRQGGIKVYGCASHGSRVAQLTQIKNYEIFSDFTTHKFFRYRDKTYPLGQFTLHQAGYEYEAYHIDYEWYKSDVGGKWNTKDGSFEELLKDLQRAPAGTRIELLVHPVWWGK